MKVVAFIYMQFVCNQLFNSMKCNSFFRTFSKYLDFFYYWKAGILSPFFVEVSLYLINRNYKCKKDARLKNLIIAIVVN